MWHLPIDLVHQKCWNMFAKRYHFLPMIFRKRFNNCTRNMLMRGHLWCRPMYSYSILGDFLNDDTTKAPLANDLHSPGDAAVFLKMANQSQAFARWHWQCFKRVRQMGRHSKSAILTNHSQEFCFPRSIINKGKQKDHVRLQIFSVVS